MRTARIILLMAGLAGVHAASAAAPAGARIAAIDATPAFWDFWDAAAGLPEEAQVQRFRDQVVAAHPELFDASVLHGAALAGAGASPDSEALIRRYLAGVGPYIPRMRALSDSVRRDFDTYAADFSRTFPAFAPRSPVYFTVSMFSFDGGTRPVAGRTALLFGIDGIARYHGEGESLKVLFDHELFHQYHDQIAPELAADDVPLWVSLWEEGLATWVSQQMNPGTSEAQALMSESLGERSRAMLPALVHELLANFSSRDSKEYAAFFYGGNSRPDLPPRSGYYVGYRIAQRLAAGRTLQQLAGFRGPKLERAVRGALVQLAREP